MSETVVAGLLLTKDNLKKLVEDGVKVDFVQLFEAADNNYNLFLGSSVPIDLPDQFTQPTVPNAT